MLFIVQWRDWTPVLHTSFSLVFASIIERGFPRILCTSRLCLYILVLNEKTFWHSGTGQMYWPLSQWWSFLNTDVQWLWPGLWPLPYKFSWGGIWRKPAEAGGIIGLTRNVDANCRRQKGKVKGQGHRRNPTKRKAIPVILCHQKDQGYYDTDMSQIYVRKVIQHHGFVERIHTNNL